MKRGSFGKGYHAQTPIQKGKIMSCNLIQNKDTKKMEVEEDIERRKLPCRTNSTFRSS